MRRFGSILIGMLVGVVAVFGLAPGANAYPEPEFDVTIDHQVIVGGNSFTVIATSNVHCEWTAEWSGTPEQPGYVLTGSGTTSSMTFHTEQVAEIRDTDVVVTCTYAGGTFSRTLSVRVLPVGSDAGAGILPDTGGPDVMFLGIGLALLVVGGTAVVLARRRPQGEV